MTTITTAAAPVETETSIDEQVEGLAGRLLESTVGALELFTVAIGTELGLYRTLTGGPATAAAIAERTGLDQRYVSEWCDQQAIAGFLDVEGDPRRFRLSPAIEPVLLDPLSPAYVAPLTSLQQPIAQVLPLLTDAFRTGEGVAYAEYGEVAAAAQAALNRPAYTNFLASEWIPAITGLDARLRDSDRPAVIADIGCGVGWSSIAIAAAYPAVIVRGYDSDELSVTEARRNAEEHGVSDRVRFEVAEGGPSPDDQIDVAFPFECLHDMAHPTDLLRNVRSQLSPDGVVVVMDERAAEDFTAPGDLVERFFGAASVVWCLPQSRTDQESEALGTLLRPTVVARIAGDAGFSSCQVVDIEHPFWRFYRLEP